VEGVEDFLVVDAENPLVVDVVDLLLEGVADLVVVDAVDYFFAALLIRLMFRYNCLFYFFGKI